MKKFLLIFVVLALLSTFAGTFYYLYAKSEEPPAVFETAAPQVATIIHKTVATGSVVPRQEVEIKPQISGIIEKLYVEPGDLVAQGDLIAKINVIPNMLNLNNAENRVNLSRIRFQDATLDLDRNRKLVDEGTISQSDFQKVEIAHQNAKEELTGAIDSLEIVRKGSTTKTESSSNTLVRATIAGMVLEVPVEVGNSVIEANTFNDGTTLATVADMDDMIFEGKVDESEVGKIRPGMDLLLTVGAIEGATFDAALEHIAPKGVEEDGAIQFEIRAALAQQDDILIRANYSANADIVLARADDVMAIDESLLQFDGDTPFVEVETAAQTFERREIETGLSDGILIQVVSGLGEEDKIKNPSSGGARS
ncbi:MAG: efflux RND transporter periplasmic adaptor subunit [bacterium]|nr:efflux RND transporter periplasmic adaptor subunit [bacterium]